MIKQEVISMTVKELINQYKITLSPTDDCKIRINNVPKDEAVVNEIKEKKAEIIEMIKADQKARDDERKRRAANVESIPGLAELKKAIADWNEWNRAFVESFEGPEAVGGMGVGPKPVDPKELMSKAEYAQAVAYLRIKTASVQHNYKLGAIGRKALDRIEDNPADWETIYADMNKEIADYTAEHAWD